MNLIEHLKRQAAERPDAAAIIDQRWKRRRVLTFAELDARSARAAALLREGGLEAGDAVLLLQPMSAELYVAVAALLRSGLVPVVLDPSETEGHARGAGRAHVAACCRLHPMRGFIGSVKTHALRLVVPEVRRIPHRFVVGGWVPGAARWKTLRRIPPLRGDAACDEATPALLTFTTGSTGAPKAALRTHGFLAAQYAALRRSLDLKPGQVDLATLPVFVLANLAAGATSVIPKADLRRPGAVDPDPILRQIRREGVTRIGASPAFFERLLAGAPKATLFPLEHLYTGGAPVFPDLLARLHAAAPHSRVVALYGSTEAEPIADASWADTTSADVEATRRGEGLLAGKPVPEVEVRILPDRWGAPLGPFSEEAFDALALPPGQAGEIVVRGPHVLPGYLGGRGDAETKIDVAGTRWHRTGDAGRFDAQGRLWLLGRCAAKVESKDGSCYPLALEGAARAQGARRTALVECGGQRVLVVEPSDGGTFEPSALREALGADVDTVRLVRHIPTDRRHNAKIDYPALRSLLAKRPKT